jgi:hypothetical protein
MADMINPDARSKFARKWHCRMAFISSDVMVLVTTLRPADTQTRDLLLSVARDSTKGVSNVIPPACIVVFNICHPWHEKYSNGNLICEEILHNWDPTGKLLSTYASLDVVCVPPKTEQDDQEFERNLKEVRT